MTDNAPQPDSSSPDPLMPAAPLAVQPLCERHRRYLAYQLAGRDKLKGMLILVQLSAALLIGLLRRAGAPTTPQGGIECDADVVACELAKGPLCCRVEEIAFRATVYLVQMRSLSADWRHAHPTEGCRVCLS